MPISAGQYTEASITRSWGVSPGSASVVLPGDDTTYAPGDEVVTNAGGAVFYGVVTAVRPSARELSGTFTTVDIADNRIRLQWESVKCVLNMIDVREDDPTTPGIDRQRRYWNIKPSDHTNQKRTWYDDPYLASEILIGIIDELAFTWTIDDPDGLLDQPVLELDANNGVKAGTIIAQICDQLGILFTCKGYNTLSFARKGTGDVPYVDPATISESSAGSALSHVDTHVEVVGGRNLYQDCQIDLEPWWNRGWEDYWLEADWLDEVEAHWSSEWASLPNDDAKQAARAAKARQVTVRQYCEKVGSTDLADYGWWGEVSRMEIPVWLYLRDIVFKAYRVPRAYTLGVFDIDSLVMREGLLAQVDYDSSSGVIGMKRDVVQYYPQERAFVLVKGQPLSLVDPRGQKYVTADQLNSLRGLWTPNLAFTLDSRPESNGIIFDDAVFVDTSENPLIAFPNQSASGIDSTHVLYNVGVPNAGVAVAPAAVRASIVWEGDKYLKSFGSGSRWGTAHAEGIQRHNIVEDGIVSLEIPYPGAEEYADDKATAFAANLIAQQDTYDFGNRVRVGGAGTELNGSVDRVTIQVDFRGGTVETVELTKERQPVTYYNERTLDRLAQQHDRYKGERANRTEVWELQAISDVNRNRRTGHTQKIGDIQQFLDAPLGVPHCSPQMATLTAAKEAGTPIWRNPGTGAVSDSGTILAGITISHGLGAGTHPIATQGTVPVRVKGPFSSGDVVGVTGSNDYAQVGGDRPVGIVLNDYADTETDTDTVLAPVRLGGVQSVVSYKPFDVRQKSARVTGGSPADAVWEIKEGTLNNVVPAPTGCTASDWGWQFPISETMYVTLQESVASNGVVSDQKVIVGNSEILDSFAPGDWPKVIHRTMAKLVYDGTAYTVTPKQYFDGSQFAYLGLIEVTCDGQTRGIIWQ